MSRKAESFELRGGVQVQVYDEGSHYMVRIPGTEISFRCLRRDALFALEPSEEGETWACVLERERQEHVKGLRPVRDGARTELREMRRRAGERDVGLARARQEKLSQEGTSGVGVAGLSSGGELLVSVESALAVAEADVSLEETEEQDDVGSEE